MEWHTTSTILESLRDQGNNAAWRQLDARFRGAIVGFARRLGISDTDAEDVAQETLVEFVSAYRRGRFDREKGRLSRWLFGIAYRQALHGRRTRQRQAAKAGLAQTETSFWDNVPDKQVASASWDREWEQALLQQCLDQVAREVEITTLRAFQLVVGQNHSPARTAEQLGVPVKTVYNAKHRVLNRIRELRAALEEATEPRGDGATRTP